MDAQVLKKEILFRCRRGWKETDLLFSRFVTAELDGMEVDALLALRNLLHESDQHIWDWYTQTHPTPDRHQMMMARLRARSGASC